jgi:hypothetical protein
VDLLEKILLLLLRAELRLSSPNNLVTILTTLPLLCMYTLKVDVMRKLSFISHEYESVLEWKPF